MGVNASIPDFFRPFRQPFHHLLLKLGRLDNLCVKVGLWHGKMEHICRLDVGHLFESGHQLRQIEKLGKPGLGPITGAFGIDFVKMIFCGFLKLMIYLPNNLPILRAYKSLETLYSKAFG
ncbi:hypothetical protein MKC53_23415, partial [[Clostridium] innocuum]|nr:hypothetical protein [[Clostridium] innocuum]